MKRKAISMILTAAMVSAMLAGCGSKTQAPAATEAESAAETQAVETDAAETEADSGETDAEEGSDAASQRVPLQLVLTRISRRWVL